MLDHPLKHKQRLASKVKALLDTYFPNPKPTLFAHNPFCWLIAVMLSAQCKDSSVNIATSTLFKLADDPYKMFKIPKSKIENIIHNCGLFKKKADAIKRISSILISDFQGEVPKTLEELQSLPMVGRKTALVVLSFAFGVSTFPVDTHILRCASRWGLSENKKPLLVEKDLCSLFDEDSWSKIHLQIIYFGREYCKASAHRSCPMCDYIRCFNASRIKS